MTTENKKEAAILKCAHYAKDAPYELDLLTAQGETIKLAVGDAAIEAFKIIRDYWRAREDFGYDLAALPYDGHFVEGNIITLTKKEDKDGE